jgi:hypothetical protein
VGRGGLLHFLLAASRIQVALLLIVALSGEGSACVELSLEGLVRIAAVCLVLIVRVRTVLSVGILVRDHIGLACSHWITLLVIFFLHLTHDRVSRL